jgi:hypothetical protein
LETAALSAQLQRPDADLLEALRIALVAIAPEQDLGWFKQCGYVTA